MSDELKLKEDAPVHGVWFWKLAIFEGCSSTFVVMGGAILAASATWTEDTFNSTLWWQWCLFWLGIWIAGVKNIQSFLSKTVSALTATAKQEDAGEIGKD